MNKITGAAAPSLATQVPRHAYSILETAHALGIGRTLVYHYIKVGQLRSFKLGKRHMIAKLEIDAFLTRMGGAA